jgi:hypothetical protein
MSATVSPSPIRSAGSGGPAARLVTPEEATGSFTVLRAILDGRVSVGADGHLRLPHGLSWPHCENPILFVRRYYAPLYEHVLGRLAVPLKPTVDTRDAHHIIIGQPGIGKSVFGCVGLQRCPSALTRCVVADGPSHVACEAWCAVMWRFYHETHTGAGAGGTCCIAC